MVQLAEPDGVAELEEDVLAADVALDGAAPAELAT
jgi:hypothetical protein